MELRILHSKSIDQQLNTQWPEHSRNWMINFHFSSVEICGVFWGSLGLLIRCQTYKYFYFVLTKSNIADQDKNYSQINLANHVNLSSCGFLIYTHSGPLFCPFFSSSVCKIEMFSILYNKLRWIWIFDHLFLLRAQGLQRFRWCHPMDPSHPFMCLLATSPRWVQHFKII